MRTEAKVEALVRTGQEVFVQDKFAQNIIGGYQGVITRAAQGHYYVGARPFLLDDVVKANVKARYIMIYEGSSQ